MLTSSGASGEEALGIIIVLAVLVIIVIVIIAFISDSKNKKNASQMHSGEVIKKSSSDNRTTATMKPVKKETFEEQLKKMEN